MALEKLMSEPEYRQVEAISYSMLSGVDKTPASLINKVKLESPSLTYGSAVDTLAFDGEEEFKKKFAIMSGEVPSKMIDTIVSEIYTIILQKNGEVIGTLDDYDDLVLLVSQNHGYGHGSIKWKDETIIRKVKDEGGRNLFQFKKESNGRQILESFDYQKVRNSVDTLFTHEFSRKWVTEDLDNGIEVTYQFPIFWNYEGENCKCLLDILHIDHKNKVIYPVDLKTSYDHVLGFPFNFIKWKYYLQAAFYTKAIRYWKLENKEYFDYRVEPFKFLVISSQNPMKPLMYRTTIEDLYIGEHGGVIKRTGEEVRGFKDLMIDMKWHIENQKFDYPRKVYENNGEMELGVF